MEYRTSSNNTNEIRSAYPSITLPVVGTSSTSSSSSYTTPSSLYYGVGVGNTNGRGGTSSSSSGMLNTPSSINGRLSSSTSSVKDVLGLRKRDAIAIITCLFLLRIAFTPNVGGSLESNGGGIKASMELAFYYPFQSIPPSSSKNTKYNKVNESGQEERTARPVPIDIDGDGIYESLVLPVHLTRDDVLKEKQMELNNDIKKKKKHMNILYPSNNKDVHVSDKELNGWSNDGSWGLRILNLKPLHNNKKGGDNVDYHDKDLLSGGGGGPFAPWTIFLSPLLPSSSTTKDDGNEEHQQQQHQESNKNTYPIKLLSIQIPIQRTKLGDEEKIRQRHKKDTTSSSSSSSSSGSYGKNSAIPPKDHPNEINYDRRRHYFCGKDWHHASSSCHKHCPEGLSTECGDGETCYADTPCDAQMPESTSNDSSNDNNQESSKTTMALTKSGTLPGIVTVWSDGSVSLHVITANVEKTTMGNDTGHRTKRTKQKNIGANKPAELEMRQLYRVYPFQPKSSEEGGGVVEGSTNGEGSIVDFVELGITFESGAIYSGGTAAPSSSGDDEKSKKKRFGDNGAILLGGRYTLLTESQLYPLRISFHALDVMTGTSLWDLKGNHNNNDNSRKDDSDTTSTTKNTQPSIPIIHTTSSARRRSHLPTTDLLDTEFDNENAFLDGDDVMTSQECMSSFRTSVLDGESGALPHEFWDDGEFGRIGVGRFDRSKRYGGKKRLKQLGKKGLHLLKNKGGGGSGGRSGGRSDALSNIGQGRQRAVGSKAGVGGGRGSAAVSGGQRSWQSDLIQRAVPRRLMKQQQYNARHPHNGKPNVVLFHGREGLAVLSLKNGRPVCHISLMDHSLYADMDADGAIDTVQVVTSPQQGASSKSSAVSSLIHQIAKEASKWETMNTPTICHALVTSGLPPREEVFTAPLCLGGPTNPATPLVAAPPLLVEGSAGYGQDVVFAMNNGVVTRYDFNGREVWRKRGGLKDGTPSWSLGKSAFMGRVQFGLVREAHSSVSASSHRNQHRPGSPVRPILLSGEDGAALVSPTSGKILWSVVYPQSVSSQPLLADMNGDGTDDLLVVSSDAIWGYTIIVETGRSGGFVIVVVTLLLAVAISALIHKSNHRQGKIPARSSDEK